MIINHGNLNALFTGFNAAFKTAFKDTESHLDKLANTFTSLGKEEDYCWLGNFPFMREWVGDRVINNTEAFSYAIKNRTFESTFSVSREDIEDDKIGVYGNLLIQLGQQSKIHPDELVFGLLKDGFSTKCYDGKYFFDPDHKAANGGSVSNMQAGAGAPWFLLDTSKLIKPFVFQKRRDYKLTALNRENDENVFMRNEYLYGVDARVNAGYAFWQLAFGSKAELTQENYSAARAAMRSLKTESGRPLHVNPTLLVVGPELEDTARKLLIAQQGDSGATNVYAGTAELLVTAWLAD